jgi:hypothetical protein
MIFHVLAVGQVHISIFYFHFISAEKYNYADMFPFTKLPTFCKLEAISCSIYQLQIQAQAFLSAQGSQFCSWTKWILEMYGGLYVILRNKAVRYDVAN